MFFGMIDKSVEVLQRDLNILGLDTGGIDGNFKDQTQISVRAVQRACGIPETGVVDTNPNGTWFVIQDQLKIKQYDDRAGIDYFRNQGKDMKDARNQIVTEIEYQKQQDEWMQSQLDARAKSEDSLVNVFGSVVKVYDNKDVLFFDDEIKWNYIGADIAKIRYGAIADKNNVINKAEINRSLPSLTPDKLAFLYLIDPNGVKDYLHFTTEDFKIEVYKELTKKEPRYWEHSWWSGWHEISKPAGELPSNVITDADILLDMMPPGDVNMKDILTVAEPYITAELVLIPVAGEASLLVDGAAAFGIKNAVALYTYGVLSDQLIYYNQIVKNNNYQNIAQSVEEKLAGLTEDVKVTDLVESATEPGKGGVTPIGRAFQKHAGNPDRAGSFTGEVSGNSAKNTAQGLNCLNNILGDNNSSVSIRNTGAYGEVLDIRLPDGTGVRYSSDGKKFIGFLEKYTTDGGE